MITGKVKHAKIVERTIANKAALKFILGGEGKEASITTNVEGIIVRVSKRK